jgi:hypothetical protein
MSDAEIDEAILSVTPQRWRKVAMILGKVMDQLWRSSPDIPDPSSQIGNRIEALVKMGKLESKGDLTKWRFSEIRLPVETD